MAFKEKLAWVTLGSMLIAYGAYFAKLASAASWQVKNIRFEAKTVRNFRFQ